MKAGSRLVLAFCPGCRPRRDTPAWSPPSAFDHLQRELRLQILVENHLQFGSSPLLGRKSELITDFHRAASLWDVAGWL